MLTVILVSIAIILLIFLVIYMQLEKDTSDEELEDITKLKIVDKTIQDMYDIMGNNLTTGEKIKKLNKTLIKAFKPKYSSIVLFDGNRYYIKATNVEEEFKDSITNVANEAVFSKCVGKNIAKYLISQQDNPLNYKSAIERKIKSAIFSPIYYNDMFLGFWFIEDVKEKAFEGISMKDLEKFKYNLSVFMENVQFQNVLETVNSVDSQTGFYNSIYLYSNARAKMIVNDNNSVSIINLTNLPEINDKYGRNVGNTLLIKIAKVIKEILPNEAIIVRYSGLCIVVAIPGKNAQVTQEIMEQVLSKIKAESEYVNDENVRIKTQILIRTVKKQSNVEREIQDMVSYGKAMKTVDIIKVI